MYTIALNEKDGRQERWRDTYLQEPFVDHFFTPKVNFSSELKQIRARKKNTAKIKQGL